MEILALILMALLYVVILSILVFLAIKIFLIIKRIEDRKKEKFEKRDN